MRLLRSLLGDTSAAAAAEMVMIVPAVVVLMFGSMELGNYFLLEHAVTKQVRDGARYASRLTLADAATYSCPGTVYADGDANTKIINVTRTGSVDASTTGRFPTTFWTACPGAQAVTVSMRCVAKGSYAGIYATLDTIPVVTVRADVAYQSLFSTLGFDSAGFCMRASSEVPVAGL